MSVPSIPFGICAALKVNLTKCSYLIFVCDDKLAFRQRIIEDRLDTTTILAIQNLIPGQ